MPEKTENSAGKNSLRAGSPALRDGLRLVHLSPELGPDGQPTPETVGLLRAMRAGFHEKHPSTEEIRRTAESFGKDSIAFIAVYDDSFQDAEEFAYAAPYPISTFGHYEKSFNVGGPELIPAHLITEVTVAATHRRQGILSAMMRSSLDVAVSAGRPVALLTASEAVIYGRFGFGIGTRVAKYELNSRRGLSFKSAPVGSVVAVDPSKIGDVSAAIFAKYHALTTGSVDRQSSYREYITGAWSDDITLPNKALRALLYRGESGEPEGFATYAFNGWGWKPPTVTVRNFVAASDDAERELWRYLANLDLIEKVTWSKAPVDTALFHALVDSEALSTTSVNHDLWVRVLDVPKVLASRSWVQDGEFSLLVRDRWEYAAGLYTVTIRGGVASVSRSDIDFSGEVSADMELDVATLGSLVLGEVTVSQLIQAGVVLASRSSAELDGLWATLRRPFCNTGF